MSPPIPAHTVHPLNTDTAEKPPSQPATNGYTSPFQCMYPIHAVKQRASSCDGRDIIYVQTRAATQRRTYTECVQQSREHSATCHMC